MRTVATIAAMFAAGICTLLYPPKRAVGAPIWQLGEIITDAGTGNFPTFPPLPLQPLANSGTDWSDIPVPSWAGVEVEVQGLQVTQPATVTLAMQRDFTLAKPAFAHFRQRARGNAVLRTGPSAQDHVILSYTTSATVAAIAGAVNCKNGNSVGFTGSLSTIGIPSRRARKARMKDCSFSAGDFRLTVSYIGEVTTLGPSGAANNVDFDFSDGIFANDGVLTTDVVGSDERKDNLGVDGVLNWKKNPKTVTTSRRHDPTMGKSKLTGAAVSYQGSFLHFTGGTIDILDEHGGLTGGVDSEFTLDPLLSAEISVTPLMFLGQEPDGRYKFSGGTVSISDPANSDLLITAEFDNYFIDDTTESPLLSSFALLEDIRIEYDDISSTFLDAFLAASKDWNEYNFLDFYFITDRNLVDVTSGFVKPTVGSVPASLFVGHQIPEPSVFGVTALGLLGWLYRRIEANR